MPPTHRFSHHQDKKIEFHEEDGKLWFSYSETEVLQSHPHRSAYKYYQTEGIIPPKVIRQGLQAISDYATARVHKDITTQKARYQKIQHFLENPDFPLETNYGRTKLKGRIVSAVNNSLVVELTDPYHGRKIVNYGFASAMAGHHILDKGGTFSDNAVETAKRLLVTIYRTMRYNEQHSDLIQLAAQLNQSKMST